MKRNLFCIILALVMLFTAVPFYADAASIVDSGKCGDNLTWTLDNTGTLTISGTGNMYDWGDTLRPWSSKEHLVKKIIINEGVTSIGIRAFFMFNKLESISIPKSMKIINEAFYDCGSLKSVYISDIAAWCAITFNSKGFPYTTTPMSYAKYLFLNGKLVTNLVIPDNVTNIEAYSFLHYEGLESVFIGKNVKTIGDCAFADCNNIKSITVHPDNKYFVTDNIGALYDVNYKKIYDYPETNTSINHYIVHYGIETIPMYAFLDSKLTSITLPESMKTISRKAFEYSIYLKKIYIPKGIQNIEKEAFSHCPNLAEVYYGGNKSDWEKISIDTEGNETLLNAIICCNSKGIDGVSAYDFILSETVISAPQGTHYPIFVYMADGTTRYAKSFKVESNKPDIVKPIRNGNKITLDLISQSDEPVNITISATDGSGIKKVCQVTVTERVKSEDDDLLERFALDMFVYNSLVEGKTVGEIAVDKQYETNKDETMFHLSLENRLNWNEFYKQYIYDYTVIKVPKNPLEGFYAAAFERDGEIIIAYRGSEGDHGFWGVFDIGDEKEIDWWGTNLPMFLRQYLSSQFSQALDFYDEVKNNPENKGKNITLTGHSLGGALASYVAINRGIKCDNINGATGWIFNHSILGNSDNYPVNFGGIEKHIFEHFNEHLDLSNRAVTRWGNLGEFNYSNYADTKNYNKKETKIKNDVVVEKLGKDYHSISSVINYSNGTFELTDKTKEFIAKPNAAIGANYMGSAKDDTYVAPNLGFLENLPSYNPVPGSNNPQLMPLQYPCFLMGGDGNDTLTVPQGANDTLIGNAGNDTLNGGAGNDIYVFGGNFGNDTIIDPSGDDRIVFTDASLLDIKISGNMLICGSNTIELSKKVKRSNHFTIEDKNKSTTTVNLTQMSLFEDAQDVVTTSGIQIFGNATAEIYDSEENLIETLSVNKDTETSVEYKDYGMVSFAAQTISLILPPEGYIVKVRSTETVSIRTVSDADNPTVAKQTYAISQDLSDGSMIVINTGELVEEQLSVKLVNDAAEESIYSEKPEDLTITADKTEIKAGETITMSVPDIFANSVSWECIGGNAFITKNEDLTVSVTGLYSGEETVRAYLPNDELYSAEFSFEISEDAAPAVAVTCGEEFYDGTAVATNNVYFDVTCADGYDTIVFDTSSSYSRIEDTNTFVINSVGEHKVNVYCKNSETGAKTSSFVFEFYQDSKKPEITGVSDKAVYYTDRIIEIYDTALDTVYVNETLCEQETFTICEAGVYSISATDKYGNKTDISFEIKEMPQAADIKQADSQTVSQIRNDFEEVKYFLPVERMNILESEISLLEEVLYTVLEITSFTAEKGETSVSVNLSIANIPENAVIYVASYNSNDQMLETQRVVLNDGNANPSFASGDAFKFKVFIWDNKLMPLANSQQCFLN